MSSLVMEEETRFAFKIDNKEGVLHKRDGMMNGLFSIYYSNGLPQMVSDFENNMFNGFTLKYYKNGQVAVEVFFNKNIPEYGFYYKKSGQKTTMTNKQLKKYEECAHETYFDIITISGKSNAY